MHLSFIRTTISSYCRLKNLRRIGTGHILRSRRGGADQLMTWEFEGGNPELHAIFPLERREIKTKLCPAFIFRGIRGNTTNQ